MRFIGEAGGEVDSGVRAAADGGAVKNRSAAGEEIPERGIDEGLAGGVHELAEVCVGLGIVGVDFAVAEVADEEVAGEDAEACGGSEGNAPGRVEIAAGDGVRDEVSVEIEDVNDAGASAGDLLATVCSGLERVGDPDLVVEDVNGPWTVVGRQGGVGERTGELGGLEVLVVDLDRIGGAEVGRDEVAGGRVGVEQSEAGIAGSRG